jgi:hypothetical protein
VCLAIDVPSAGRAHRPAIVWFVKVQEALNRYWESAVPETAAAALA